jgi:hypothetical protein
VARRTSDEQSLGVSAIPGIVGSSKSPVCVN